MGSKNARHPAFKKRTTRFETLILLLIALLLFQFDTIAQDTDNTQSAWGKVVTITQTPWRSAPALWISNIHTSAVWTQIDDESVLQFHRSYEQGELTEPRHLTIPPVFPHDQMLLEATRDVAHLLWLDVAYNAPNDGLRLWGAEVDVNGFVQRNELALSEEVTYQFDAIALDDQTIEVVWSEGRSIAEPNLYARSVDVLGRPRAPRRLASDADWPTLAQDSTGQMHLFWIAHDNYVMQATLGEDGLEDIRMLTSAPYLAAGDILYDFQVGIDRDHAYLFWNMSRADGSYQTYFTSGALQSGDWQPPRSLGIQPTDGILSETGFNIGAIQQAISGDQPATWAAPLRGQYDLLPVAVQMDDTLAVLLFQNGQIVAYQPIISLPNPGLLAPPTLVADRADNLTLAWAEASGIGTANLKFTTTRRN